MPVMSTMPAPAIATTSASDPGRPGPGAGVGAGVGGGGEADGEAGGEAGVGGGDVPALAATSMFAVRTNTDPEASVPVAVSVYGPNADAGIVTLPESTPVSSVCTVASSCGADEDDSIVTWTGENGTKPSAETVIWAPAAGFASETVSWPLGPYCASTACDPRTRRRSAAAIAT